MAILIANASNAITGAATFAAVSTGTGAVAQTVTTKTSYTTTSYTYGSAFTGTNLDVVDGVLVHLRRNGTTGTISIALSEDNGTTATREVTVNASDLPTNYAWCFIKFGSTLTLDGGTDYKVGFKVSVGGSGVTIGRDGTPNNWAHILRKTTAATAGAGDVMYIAGEHTGAGATTTITVTMDQTATTDYGTGTDGAIDNGLEIGDAGVLTYSTNIAAYLKLSGSLNVWANGTLNVGTVATPVERGSSAVLEFDPAADGGMGLIINDGGICNIQGLSRTSGKNIYYCKLNTDEAANSTSLGVDTDTGWLDNDEIAVFSTTRTGSQTEKGTLNGAANASDLPVDGFAGAGGGLANAHSGTSPTQAEVILLTRNVRIRSATSTVMTYIHCGLVGTIDADWVEFYYMGDTTSNHYGIFTLSGTFTGSFTFNYCSLHDFEDQVWQSSALSGSGTIVFSNNVGFNLDSTGTVSGPVALSASSGTVATIDGNILHFGGITNSGGCVFLNDVGLTFTNNTVVYQGGNTSSVGISLAEAAAIGTFSGNTVHSGTGFGISQNGNLTGGSIVSCSAWRNGNSGLNVGSNAAIGAGKLVISSLTLTGNVSPNLATINGLAHGSPIEFRSPTVNSDASFTTAVGWQIAASGMFLVFNGAFGGTTTHGTGDIAVSSGANYLVHLVNTTLSSATEVSAQTGMPIVGYIRSHKHDASSTTFKDWYRHGTIQNDTATRHTASGYSWKLTPNNATNKLILPGPTDFDTFKVTAAANIALTITGYVYKDATYNGNAPRLVVVGGIVAGVGSAGTDVTDSLTVAHSNWEQLSVQVTPTEDGVVEFYFDCDGTAGNAYVDDIAVDGTRVSTGTMDVPSRGLPETGIYAVSSGGLGGPVIGSPIVRAA